MSERTALEWARKALTFDPTPPGIITMLPDAWQALVRAFIVREEALIELREHGLEFDEDSRLVNMALAVTPWPQEEEHGQEV